MHQPTQAVAKQFNARVIEIDSPLGPMTWNCVVLCCSFPKTMNPMSAHPTEGAQARSQAAPDYSAAVSRPQLET